VAHPWANVIVDGEQVDTTPFARAIPLSPGVHYVRLEHPKAPVERRTVTLEAGETVLLDVKMDLPRARPAHPEGPSRPNLTDPATPWGLCLTLGPSVGENPSRMVERALLSGGRCFGRGAGRARVLFASCSHASVVARVKGNLLFGKAPPLPT
jgi:hypothetical protein